MKVKLLALLVAISAVFVGSVLWRTDSFFHGDRMSWVEAQSRTQLASMNHALGVELKSLQRAVSAFSNENLKREQMNWASVAPFYAVLSFNLNEGEIEPNNLLIKENSRAVGWSKEFVKSALGKVPNKGKDLRYLVLPFKDNNRGNFVGVVFYDGSKGYAIFGNGEIFQSLIDEQKGSMSSFSIVNLNARVVGHTISEYLGSTMRDDILFKEAKNTLSSHGSGIYRTESGQELFGMFEQVPHSNLMIISSAPLKDVLQGRSALWWQILLFGFGLVLVASGIVLLIVLPREKKMTNLESELILARQKLNTPEVSSSLRLEAGVSQTEKLKTSMRVASALAHEMSGPLTAILGYSQSILAKEPEGEIVTSAESILRETRTARNMLDKVLIYAGEEVHEKKASIIEQPLDVALKKLDSLLVSKGVKIIKNFDSKTPVLMHVGALGKALENILMNSVEAMERMVKKEISISITEDENNVNLIIEDSGEGIESKNLQKIFDPFFTTRSFQNHMGLGLSVAFGVLREHGVEVDVISERGHGTQLLMSFKKQKSLELLMTPEGHSVATLEVNSSQILEKSDSIDQVKNDQLMTGKEVLSHQESEKIEQSPEYQSLFGSEVDLEQANKVIENNSESIFALMNEGHPVRKLTGDEKQTLLAESPLDVNLENLFEMPSVQDFHQSSSDSLFVGAVLAPMDSEDEFIIQKQVQNPPKEIDGKQSILDSYSVEIRKPGKRN